MGQALYRKYRSKSLSEVVGQEHITQALERAIKLGSISHAYLFTGPRGVGKTSIARILAYEVNGLPYESEANHLDIIEIDAASNRRIDEVRDLRDKVHIAPTQAKYKVYIIDEVHMLTREAFNALLKTLEEPPAHVIFILATTEAHKLPETIVSRTQHYAFKPIPKDKVVAHLSSIAEKEAVRIDKDALMLIAEHGEGSFRDSISLLDQIRNFTDHVTLKDVQMALGIAPQEAVDELVQALASHDVQALITTLQALSSQGIEAPSLSKQLIITLRTQLLDGTLALKTDTALALLEQLIEVPASYDSAAALELCLMKVVFEHTPPSHQTARATQTVVPKPQKKASVEEVTPSAPVQSFRPRPKQVESEEVTQKSTTHNVAVVNEANWPDVLTLIKQRYNTIYGILRMASPVFEKDVITLSFKFAFHQKRINDPKNKKIVIDAVQSVCGGIIKVECIMQEAQPEAGSQQEESNGTVPLSPKASEAPLQTISNIFGGAELLES
jgi:DNA polymerase-3 subunit gamma/tau